MRIRGKEGGVAWGDSRLWETEWSEFRGSKTSEQRENRKKKLDFNFQKFTELSQNVVTVNADRNYAPSLFVTREQRRRTSNNVRTCAIRCTDSMHYLIMCMSRLNLEAKSTRVRESRSDVKSLKINYLEINNE